MVCKGRVYPGSAGQGLRENQDAEIYVFCPSLPVLKELCIYNFFQHTSDSYCWGYVFCSLSAIFFSRGGVHKGGKKSKNSHPYFILMIIYYFHEMLKFNKIINYFLQI